MKKEKAGMTSGSICIVEVTAREGVKKVLFGLLAPPTDDRCDR